MNDLYSHGDEPATAPAPMPHPMDAVAQKLYAPIPEQREMHPIDLALKPAFVSRDAELGEQLGETQAQRAARADAHVKFVTEIGVDPYSLGQMLYNLEVDADLAALRGEDDVADAQLQAWSVETRQQLAATYGQEEAEKLLTRTDKYTQTYPKLHALLGRRGYGSRPSVVLPVVAHVRAIDFR